MTRSLRAIVLIAALPLAACDLLPKRAPAGSVDTLPKAAGATRRDTMSDAAAAESARAFARKEWLKNAPLIISVSGAQHYSADSGFQVSCTASESNGERLLQVEALGRTVHLNFTIYNGKDGEALVGNVYNRKRGRTRIGNVDVEIGVHSYADGTGKAEITDPVGRSGSMSVSRFIKMGAKKNESHRADLTVHLRWNCD